MDVKIGLLVQNRISVQDCLQEHSRKTGVVGTLGRRERGKENKENQGEVGTHRGLKALKKESHDKLLAYQHLFHLLQTDPSYLARLMFAMPQSKTNKFLEFLEEETGRETVEAAAGPTFIGRISRH